MLVPVNEIPTSTPRASTVAVPRRANIGWPREAKAFFLCAVAVALCFSLPLYKLMRFAAQSSLYSHILLIPFIASYLIRLQWSEADSPVRSGKSRPLAIGAILIGAGLLIGYRFAANSGWQPAITDYFCVYSLAALSFFYAGCFLLVDFATLRHYAFPLAFLIFAVPLPDRLYRICETFLQYRSADAANLLYNLSGMPVWRNSTEFSLPGFSLAVAPECSGIHSSLVLFISSFLAARLLLRRTWTRALLIAAIIPLGILRNGFRIWTLGELCVHDSHDWINSPLHHQGGPIFFALSLIPLFALLLLLRKFETKKASSVPGLLSSDL